MFPALPRPHRSEGRRCCSYPTLRADAALEPIRRPGREQERERAAQEPGPVRENFLGLDTQAGWQLASHRGARWPAVMDPPLVSRTPARSQSATRHRSEPRSHGRQVSPLPLCRDCLTGEERGRKSVRSGCMAGGQSPPVISRSVRLRSPPPGYDSLAPGKPRCGVVCRYQLSRDFPSPFPGIFSHLPALRCSGSVDETASHLQQWRLPRIKV
jgi:hypothetical protein